MVSLCVGSSAGSVIMAQESSDPKHVSRAVQEMRQEDPAALVEMEERAKRPKHMSLWGKLQVLERKVCAAPLVAFTMPAKVR